MKRKRSARGRLFEAAPGKEVQDELEFHVEERTREFMARGMDEASARRAALEKIGDMDQVRGECADLLAAERRSLRRRDWLSDLQQDLRFAVRSSARAPLFTIMAILTLALGIGANAAVFGVVKSVLLDALPYEDPDRLVRIESRLDATPDAGSSLSAGTIDDVAQRQRSFSAVAASVSNGPDGVLESDAGASTVRVSWIDPHYFAVLGVRPARGRSFAETDVADTARVTVLTHQAWSRYFGSADDILGRGIVINGIPRTVVGVLPRSYVHPVAHAEFFLPLNLRSLLSDPITARGSHFLELIGRVREDTNREMAEQDIAGIGRALQEEHPWDNKGISLRAVPLRDTMVGDTRTPLVVLMGSAALVLLIACANLAAALLSRTLARRREFSVRISLGAGRGRLVRQLLAESVLLAGIGGLAGLLLANAALGALRASGLELLPDHADLTLDRGAIIFTFALALLTGMVFGVMPALSVSRAEPQSVLRDESRGSTGARSAGRVRGVMVAVQVALCLSLLTGAGLLTRSLWIMATAPLGFDTANALTFNVTLPQARYPNAAARDRFNEEATRVLEALPGVRSVTMTMFLPTNVGNSNGVTVVGAERDPDEAVPFILTNGVSENYFATMQIPLTSGRAFTSADNGDGAPVAIVSEAMARRFWPNGNPVGERIRMGPDPESTPIEVVGVAADVRTKMTTAGVEPLLYRPVQQWRAFTFVLRTQGDPALLANDARRAINDVDSAVPVSNVMSLEQFLSQGLAMRRLPMLLMLAFGGLALLLACIGIHALFANMAIAREREFGVRMALGSTRSEVASLVLREGAVWMAAGLAAGALGVYAVARALQSLVYGIAPLDMVSIAGAVGALLLSAGIALAAPVRRATRSDPMMIMR